MRKKIWITFAIILLLAIGAGIVDWPSGPDFRIGDWHKEIKIHQGLDLQGGTHLVYELDTSGIEEGDRNAAVESVIDVIDNRINALGVSEPVLQSAKIGNTRTVIVELPGISDVDQAISLIGKTAQLSFWETSQSSDSEGKPTQGFVPTQLTGAHLKRADISYDQTSGDPQVAIEFNNEGKDLFAQITKRNLQKPVAIVLDNEIISAPTVQSEITDGQAVITGQFSITEAKNLAKLLNAGALPVPIKIIEQRNIEATLGSNSVKQSLMAGLIGILLVAIYMILYYRLPGVLAVMALIIYSLIVLALFKLIPVTLTLAGIAGFILSIGMAVDANILIFERMKEELAQEKTLGLAIEAGFSRAWPSIRDSNVSSLITCTILYFTTSGLVKGFAITLAIGILISMFSAIIITRNFLRLLINTKLAGRIR